MESFYPFFLIIFAGVFSSIIFRRIHVPWVVGLILGGIVAGPHMFNLIEVTPAIDMFGQIGLIFLMFMAGLETRISSFNEFRGGLLLLAFINGAVPFAVGFGIGTLFGYSLLGSLLIGIIFVSSAIAVVIPSLEKYGLLDTKLGQSVVITSVIQDVASLVLLSVVLQQVSPATDLPLIVFYSMLALVLFGFRYLLPKAMDFFVKKPGDSQDLFQQEFRAAFLILLGTVVAFEFLGLHPIIGGFFAGFVLSNSVKGSALYPKIHTISYGIFIPVFFIILGAQTDIGVFQDLGGVLPFVAVIVAGSVLAKFFSGWLAGRMVGFTSDQALLFGVSSIPQLSTTLAVAYTALSLDLVDQRLTTAMIILSVMTVIISPTLMNILQERIRAATPETKRPHPYRQFIKRLRRKNRYDGRKEPL